MRHTVHIFIGEPLSRLALGIYWFLDRYDHLRDSNYTQVFCLDSNDHGGYAIGKPESKEHTTINSDEEYADWLTKLYRETVNIDNADVYTDLYVCLYLPLYRKSHWETAKRFAEMARKSRNGFSVDIFGLCHDLRDVIEPDSDMGTGEAAKQTLAVAAEINECIKTRMLHRFLFMQNTNCGHMSLNLDILGLAYVIGEYCMLVTDDYASLFPPNEVTDIHEVTVVGIAAVWFEKDYFVNYLLKKAYIFALQREGIGTESVDVNKIANIAKNILSGHTSLFKDFYEEDIAPLVKQSGSGNAVVAQLNQRLDERIAQIENCEILSILRDKNLSLPEKEATLAQLLGNDDEYFDRDLFDKDQPEIDDCMASAIELFINEDNMNVVEELDESGKPIVDSNGNPTHTGGVLAGSNESGGNNKLLLPDIKRLRSEIKGKTAYIRDKTKDLEEIGVGLERTQEREKVLTSEGFSYGGVVYRLEDDVVQTPLEETYVPDTAPLAEVDLRSKFSPIRSQGSLGSCTAFASTSVFEYIANRVHNVTDTSFSPLFVYYNVNHDENGSLINKGTSFYDIMRSMGDNGVCEEEYCAYSDEPMQGPPSPEAFENAENYKVLKAVNVEVDRRSITSALSAGYPVAISLRLFDSFTENNNGFVFYPSDAERASEEAHWHAMVIVGYLNKASVYIVRNSWGERFGDKGYCYIPYAYIENQELCRQACTITETNIGKPAKMTIPKALTIPFDKIDNYIEYELLRAEIDKERNSLEKIQLEYELYCTAYKKHLVELGNPANRKKIVERARTRKEFVIATKKQEYDEAVNTDRPVRLKAKRRHYRILFIWLTLASLAAITSLVLGLVFNASTTYIIVTSIVTALFVAATVGIVPFGRTHYKKYKLQLQEESEILNREIEAYCNDAEHFEIKMHMAGRVIDEVCELKRRLLDKYSHQASFVANLKQWLAEIQKEIDSMSPEISGPFVGILDNDTLDSYFESYKDKVTNSICLCEHIDDYSMQDDGIIRFRDEILQNLLIDGLNDTIRDFSMYRYLTGQNTYSYLRPASDLQDVISDIENKSRPFAEDNSVRTDFTLYKNIYIHTDNQDEKSAWNNLSRRLFTDTVASRNISTSNELIISQIEILQLDELDIFQQ